MPDVLDLTDTWLVIGAGASGLVAAKNLGERGISAHIVEREAELGGNWNLAAETSRIYDATHMISSKPFTELPDFPMPDHAPDYLHHTQVLDYLDRYARHFSLRDRIEFRTEVVRCEPHPDGGFEVLLRTPDGGEEQRRYAGLVVANGHNWFPKMPGYPGQDDFAGEIIHAADFKTGSHLDGKRVVVVGAGNTGCDIVVEAVQRAAAVHHSTRRGYWYAPKYALGKPADQVADLVLSLRLPRPVTQWLFQVTAQAVAGRYQRLGLRRPDHGLLEAHPVVNQQLLYWLGHGAIDTRPDIHRFDGGEVVFTDGSRVTADLVIFATGYLIRFPFLDDTLVNWADGRPHLFRNILPPHRRDLYVAGLIQPDSGVFKLMHWQTVLIAELILLQQHDPAAADRFWQYARGHLEDRSQWGVHLVESTRHYVEVKHLEYLEDLARDLDLVHRLAGARV